MSEIHDQIKQSEAELAKLKAVAEQRDQMVRLINNADFRKLITEGFCRDEAARYVKLSIDPSVGDPADRADALGMAQAAGYFQRWINAFLQMSENAANTIPDVEAMLEELRALPEEA